MKTSEKATSVREQVNKVVQGKSTSDKNKKDNPHEVNRTLKPTLHNVKASTQYKREHKPDYGHEKIEILYEDKDIVVINKPSGLLSVPYPGSRARTAYSVLEEMMRKNGTWTSSHRPFIVHRLDRDTSGVMMFSLNEPIQQKIMNTWHHMVTERLYHAVAENPRYKEGALPASGTIDDPLTQNAHHVGYVPKAGNKKFDDDYDSINSDKKNKLISARTHYTILVRGTTHTLFELSLDTGRKNQIRAHLASKDYPLAGDENYRARTDPFHRLALHARTLDFVHPVTGKQMHFEVPEPESWKAYVEKGDPKPETPVWKQERKTLEKVEAYKMQNEVHLTHKQETHMDFISRGKARGRR